MSSLEMWNKTSLLIKAFVTVMTFVEHLCLLQDMQSFMFNSPISSRKHQTAESALRVATFELSIASCFSLIAIRLFHCWRNELIIALIDLLNDVVFWYFNFFFYHFKVVEVILNFVVMFYRFFYNFLSVERPWSFNYVLLNLQALRFEEFIGADTLSSELDALKEFFETNWTDERCNIVNKNLQTGHKLSFNL